ncbi:MAG: PAS domain S-box protein [Proteobacteria bacterium]|nr:PAS domain S-box protein [Pseudomonadota bacterium]
MIMVNAAGRIEMVNIQAERVFGYARTEMVGQPVEMLLPERMRGHHPALRGAFFGDPQSRPMGIGRELFARRKDGSEFPVEIGLNPIDTSEGTMVLSAIVDISERKRSEERFRLVVEAAPNAMVMINARGEIEMVNAQAERVFGYTRAELLGRPVEMLVPERFRGHHPALRNSFSGSAEARSMGAGRDLFALRKDGSEFPVEIGLNPIETEDGVMVLSAIVDISDRKQKEYRIEQALKEKDLLLGEIHHRVKNNLQIVHSLLDLQSGQISDQAVLAMLRDAQNRVHSMALIHQTLYQSQDFAKVDFGTFLDSFVPVLISSYALHGNNIALDISTQGVALPINTAVPCGLIVNELVSNALKHAFPDGQQGKILLELRAVDDRNLVLSVSDDGVGLPPDLDARMAGSLGLQLVSTLGAQLRGKLDIHHGQPTRFMLHFPHPDGGR